VLGGVLAAGEQAGRLDHHVDPEVAPGKRRRVALGEHLQRLAVDRDRALARLYLGGEAPEDRVVLEQVGQRAGVGDVVDGDELDVRARGVRRTEEIATDPAEAVDADLHCHELNPPGVDALTFEVSRCRR
jgi:hypothetical protein